MLEQAGFTQLAADINRVYETSEWGGGNRGRGGVGEMEGGRGKEWVCVMEKGESV